MLSVIPSHADISSISVINNIEKDGETFLLDLVRDPVVHRKIVEGSTFTISTSLEGVDIRVEKLSCNQIVGEEENESYEVNLPEIAYYFQRRQAFRAPVTGLAKITASVALPPTEDNQPTSSDGCGLFDISATGCSISLPETDGKRLTDYAEPLLIRFDLLESSETLEVMALVRHSRHLERAKAWRIGFEFQDISNATSYRIDQVIAQLQMLTRKAS